MSCTALFSHCCLLKGLLHIFTFTHSLQFNILPLTTHKLIHLTAQHQEQFGIQYLAHGHFDILTCSLQGLGSNKEPSNHWMAALPSVPELPRFTVTNIDNMWQHKITVCIQLSKHSQPDWLLCNFYLLLPCCYVDH